MFKRIISRYSIECFDAVKKLRLCFIIDHNIIMKTRQNNFHVELLYLERRLDKKMAHDFFKTILSNVGS